MQNLTNQFLSLWYFTHMQLESRYAPYFCISSGPPSPAKPRNSVTPTSPLPCGDKASFRNSPASSGVGPSWNACLYARTRAGGVPGYCPTKPARSPLISSELRTTVYVCSVSYLGALVPQKTLARFLLSFLGATLDNQRAFYKAGRVY